MLTTSGGDAGSFNGLSTDGVSTAQHCWTLSSTATTGLWCVSMTLMSVLSGDILMAAEKSGRHAACQLVALASQDSTQV